MIRAWKAFWDSLAVDLERYASELRTGVTLIEAVAADNFEAHLQAITGGEQFAMEAREIALDAAKCGMTPNNAREAFNEWLRDPIRRNEG